MYLVAAILFVLLSPGVLLTLPPVGKKIFMSGKTSVTAILVHAVVFGIALYFVKDLMKPKRVSGFQGSVTTPKLLLKKGVNNRPNRPIMPLPNGLPSLTPPSSAVSTGLRST